MGLKVEAKTYATKQAAEVALRAKEVHVVVDDFIGVVLARQTGLPVRAVYPFSRLTGGWWLRRKAPSAPWLT